MKAARGFDPTDFIGDALRVLKRLAAPGAHLSRRTTFYALTGTGHAGRALHVPTPLVDAMRRRDWLAAESGPRRSAGALVLSETGIDWLKRALNADDPFAARHSVFAPKEIALNDGRTAMVTVNQNESPIGRLHVQTDTQGKPLIDEVQFMSGERLRRDFTLANLEPRLGVDLTAPVVAGRRGANHDELSDIAIAARQRYARAVAVLGPGLADVATDVCCHLKEPFAAESTQGWSDNAALVVLRLALDRLAAHYGFTATGQGFRTRAWRAPEEEGGAAAEGGRKRQSE